jgi:hypothetical protein
MILALVSALFLDNTIEGNCKDRGLTTWRRMRTVDIHNQPEYTRVYGLPHPWAGWTRNCGYLEYFAAGQFPVPPADGVYGSAVGNLQDLCGRRQWKTEDSPDGDKEEDPSSSSRMLRA